jgi:acyl-coenzyme A thioesterase PaaI-like protein
VQYHKPVYVGQYVHVIGELVEVNEKSITARGEIRDENNTLVSEAMSTMIRIRPVNMMRHIQK